MKIVARLLLGAFALLLTAELLSGIELASLYIAIIAAVVLSLLNVLVRPVLIVLTLPITVLTLGLFIFVLNALLFYFASSFVEGFYVDSFAWALIGSVLVTLINTVGNRYL